MFAMETDIQDEIFSFRQELLRSRNYYSRLWGRYKSWLWTLWFVEACAGVLVLTKWFDLNSVWARIVLLVGIVLPATKKIMTLPQRIKDLEWQYHECQDILNALEVEKNPTADFVAAQRQRFSAVEKLDQPTIQCLMAICANEAFVAMDVKKRFKMTWYEYRIGPYVSWIKYDDHAELVDVE